MKQAYKMATLDDIAKAAKFYRDDVSLIDEIRQQRLNHQQNSSMQLLHQNPKLLAQTLNERRMQLKLASQYMEDSAIPSGNQYTQKAPLCASSISMVVGSKTAHKVRKHIDLNKKSLQYLKNKSMLLQTSDVSYLQDRHKHSSSLQAPISQNNEQPLESQLASNQLKLQTSNDRELLRTLGEVDELQNNKTNSLLKSIGNSKSLIDMGRYNLPIQKPQGVQIMDQSASGVQNQVALLESLNKFEISPQKQSKKQICQNLPKHMAQDNLERFFAANNNKEEEFFKNYYIKNQMHNRIEFGKKGGASAPSIATYDDAFDRMFSDFFLQQRKLLQNDQMDWDQFHQQASLTEKERKPLGQPTGRKDAQLLSMWFYQSIKDNLKNECSWQALGNDEKSIILENVKTINQVCMKELIRQVSVICLDRGQLLEKLLEVQEYFGAKELHLINDKQEAFKADIKREKKKQEADQTKQFMEFSNRIDGLHKQLYEKDNVHHNDIEMLELLRSKLELMAQKNADLLKDNHIKEKKMLELNYEMDKLYMKVQKHKDKKRVLNRKLIEQLNKPNPNVEEVLSMAELAERKDTRTNGFFIQQRQKAQSQGKNTERCQGNSCFSMLNSMEDDQLFDYSNTNHNDRSSLSRVGKSFKVSRPMTNKISDKDRESIYNQEAQQIEMMEDVLAEDEAFQPYALKNNDQDQAQNQKLDDVSLDSFQLINKEDEEMNDYLGQNEEERQYVQKNIMIERFNKQLEINEDFQAVLKKAEDIHSQILALLANDIVFDKESLFPMIKEIITQLFKQELELVMKVSKKSKKLKQMLLQGEGRLQGEDVDKVEPLGVTYSKNTKISQGGKMTGGQIVRAKVIMKDGESQTDLLDYYDFGDIEVNLAELYRFEKQSSKMVKTVIDNSQSNKTTIKQVEYLPTDYNLAGQQGDNQSYTTAPHFKPKASVMTDRLPSRQSSSLSPTKNKSSSISIPNKNNQQQQSFNLKASPVKTPKQTRDFTPQGKQSVGLNFLEGTEGKKTEKGAKESIPNKILVDKNKKLDDILRLEGQLKILNLSMKDILRQVQDYEVELQGLKVKKRMNEAENSRATDFDVKLAKSSFNDGYEVGFQKGLAHGCFKGGLENRHVNSYFLMRDGLQEGWMVGFDDGVEFGMKKVFKDAYNKGIDLSGLDIKDYIDIQKLKREKMNEFEKLFNAIEHSDKQERLLRVIEEYKGLSKKKKLKYATIGRKNLFKLINQFYAEKFTNQKGYKTLLIEIVYDQTKIKYGNDGITDKKLYRLFSSAIYHAPTSKRIAMFARFLMLGKKNLSNEVLQIYILGFYYLKNKNFNNTLNRISNKTDNEYVAVTRALDSFRELFEKLLPGEIFGTLRKKVESLIIKDELSHQLSIVNIDSDRFLEYCTGIYQRFCLNYNNRLQMIFNAWTLFQENFLTAEEIYVTLQVLSGRAKKIKFNTPAPNNSSSTPVLNNSNNGSEEKTPAELIGNLKDKLGLKFALRLDQFIEIFGNSDLATNRQAQADIFDQIVLFDDNEQMMARFHIMMKELRQDLLLLYGQMPPNMTYPYLDSQAKWNERLSMIELQYSSVHPSLLCLSFILYKKVINFFRDLKGKEGTIVKKREDNSDLQMVREGMDNNNKSIISPLIGKGDDIINNQQNTALANPSSQPLLNSFTPTKP